MKKQRLILFSLIILFFFTNLSLSKEEKIISGKALVVDGDTIKINKKKIRLFGIDAPEKKQICQKIYLSFIIFNFQKDYPCGEESSLVLLKKLQGKKVECILENNKDKYKRYIGTCYIQKQDINGWLVKNGYAVAYRKYSKRYVLQEQYAKKNKLGLWRGNFLEPEKWRRIMN